MTQYDPRKHHRHTIRLPGYDYSLAGMYYVTICTNKRLMLFGGFDGTRISRMPSAEIVEAIWNSLPSRFSDINLDRFVVMPNHVHGIIVLKDRPPGIGIVPVADGVPGRRGPLHERCSLSEVVREFKSRTADAYRLGVKKDRWKRYIGRLWQRGYYEHIIRDAESLDKIRDYIEHNPERWILDRENPMMTDEDPFDVWFDSLGDERLVGGEAEEEREGRQLGR